jgi:hypothetical protein
MNILDMKQLEYHALPESERAVMRLYASQTSVDSAPVLKQRIMEYVYVNSFENRPVTLADINRRFSRPAKRFGTTTLTLVMELVGADILCVIERRGQRGIYNRQQYDEQLKVRLVAKMPGDLAETLIESMLEA